MDELNAVIAETFQIPPEAVPDDATAETVPNWDSLGHLNLVMALEEKYRIRFTLEEIMAMRDVPTVRRIVTERTAERRT